jgi:hypothetical protein
MHKITKWNPQAIKAKPHPKCSPRVPYLYFFSCRKGIIANTTNEKQKYNTLQNEKSKGEEM